EWRGRALPYTLTSSILRTLLARWPGAGLRPAGCAGSQLRTGALEKPLASMAQLPDAVRDELLRTIVGSSPVAIQVIDDQNRVLLSNPAAERLFGGEFPG